MNRQLSVLALSVGLVTITLICALSSLAGVVIANPCIGIYSGQAYNNRLALLSSIGTDPDSATISLIDCSVERQFLGDNVMNFPPISEAPLKTQTEIDNWLDELESPE